METTISICGFNPILSFLPGSFWLAFQQAVWLCFTLTLTDGTMNSNKDTKESTDVSEMSVNQTTDN